MNNAVRKNKTALHKQVVCPFCSLLCDDLTVKAEEHRLTITENGCPKAALGFGQDAPLSQPQINGKPVTLDEAIQHAAMLMKRAKQPLISGMGTDAAGCRAALLLAEKSGAIIDHQAGDALLRNILVLQTSGWIMTTLAELKNRADLILFVGTDTRNDYPRFFERFIDNPSSLFLKKSRTRKIVFLGDALKIHGGMRSKQNPPAAIPCAGVELGDYVSILLGLLKNKTVPSRNIAAARFSKLKKLAEQLKSAKYSVIVWSPAALDFPHGDLTIQSLGELIRELNLTTRAAGLSLGGDNGAGTFINVCAWQSGYPLRVSYQKKHPVYDPHHFSTRKLLDKAEVDLMLWISSFSREMNLPETNIPRIILARPADKLVSGATVYIPVATPGLDHDGNLFRTDGVINLPLRKLRAGSHPGVADVINRMNREI